jgi:hypothetical protein
MGEHEKEGREREDRGDEAEMMARMREEIANLPVAEHMAYMLHSLSALAVGRLGMTAETTERRDLGQARLAIDAFKALLTVLEPVRSAGEIAASRGMLSQLQLAYAGAIGQVETASQAGGERSAPPAPKEGEATKTRAAAKKTPAAAKKPAATKKAPPRVKRASGEAKKAPASAGSSQSGS